MKLTFRILSCLVMFSSFLAGDRFQRKPLGVPYFHAVTPGYPTESPDTSRLDVIIKVPYDAIQFLKKRNFFEAEYELSVSIQDAEGNQIDERIWSDIVQSEQFRKTISPRSFELEKQSFFLKPQEYTCIIELTDMDTRKSGRRTIIVDLTRFNEKLAFSDLLLVNPNIKTDTFTDGLPIIPPQITDADTSFHVYYEGRVSSGEYSLITKVISVKDEILQEERESRESAGAVVKGLLEHERVDVSQNKFKLRLEAEQGDDTAGSDLVIVVKWRGLTTHVEDIQEAIEQIRYIATRDETNRIQRAKGTKQEQLFKQFWKERDPTPNTVANELMDEYYRRVHYANEKFGTFQDGWKTDMGMIFVLFGPPDDIEVNLFARDGRSYQKWHYYLISRSFVFVDYNGFGDYELIEPYYSPYGYRRR